MDRIKETEEKIREKIRGSQENLRKYNERLKALKVQQRVRDRKAERKRESRRKAVLGLVVLKAVRDGNHPGLRQEVEKLLHESLDDDHDRGLFADMLPEPAAEKDQLPEPAAEKDR